VNTTRLLLCLGLIWSQGVLASGQVRLTQDRFRVQDKADFSWIYEVAEEGLQGGDSLRIYDPVFQGMRWSKWGDLTPWWDACTEQTTEQEASWGLVSAHVRRDDVRLSEPEILLSRSNCDEEERECSSNIHQIAWTEIELLDGELLPGDEVVVGIGDVGDCEARCTEGSCGVCSDCGFEMPDRAFPDVAWPAKLCPAGAECESLEPPHIEISARTEPDLLLAMVPSQVMLGEPMRVKVALLDRWGNAISESDQILELRAPDGTQTHTLIETDGGWHDFEVVLDKPGIHRLEVVAGPMGTWTNPVEVLEEAPVDQIYWGDIHVHHGYTFVDEDGGTHDLNHDYGRDVVGLDIVAQTQKAEGIEINGDRLWSELQLSCRAYSEPDAYLVLLGFEWMGEKASESAGEPSEGHHNVYYDGCEAPIGTHDLSVIDSVDGDLGLWTWLETVTEETGVNGLTVPHATRWTGHNFEVQNPGTQTLVEVYSEWGDSTEWSKGQLDSLEPGTLQDLMNSGLRLGWIGGSDNHDGWMGNPSSQKSVTSGLGAFISTRLTRSAVFSAMQQRRTFATTGHRPILRFRVEDGGVKLGQGSELISRDPVLRWRYSGTEKVERLRLFRVGMKEDAAQTVLIEEQDPGLDLVGELSLGPSSAGSAAYWLEIRQWDGEIAWSSPIWLSSDCDRIAQGAQDPLGRCVEPGAPEGEAPPKTRCSCAQGPAQGGAWVLLVVLALIRRSEARSQPRGRG
jgi:hypothetical protein